MKNSKGLLFTDDSTRVTALVAVSSVSLETTDGVISNTRTRNAFRVDVQECLSSTALCLLLAILILVHISYVHHVAFRADTL